MENNIFEGAKFGDKFLTKDGRIAIYQRYTEELDLENPNTYLIAHILFTDNISLMCSSSGDTQFENDNYDIISKYQEPIDEEKLNKLAFESIPEYCYEPSGDYMCVTWEEAYKKGYRKAKEE